jgi:hypothetical protein
MDLIGTTSSTSFTQSTTFGKRHHSLPYNILCVSPRGLHPNVTFPLDSQMSQNFGRSYLSKIMYVLGMQGQYLIELEKIFLMVYKTPKSNFI